MDAEAWDGCPARACASSLRSRMFSDLSLLSCTQRLCFVASALPPRQPVRPVWVHKLYMPAETQHVMDFAFNSRHCLSSLGSTALERMRFACCFMPPRLCIVGDERGLT